MAFQSSHGRSSRVRTDQQGSDQGGGKVHPRACRIAFPEAEFLAGAVDQATGARSNLPVFGERLKYGILVVEDNQLNRELLCDWLEVEGYDVAAASTLEQAFAAIHKLPPDLVLLDVQLGDQDGLSVARWIRRQPTLSHIPVIAVT